MTENWTRREVLKSAAAMSVGTMVGGCQTLARRAESVGPSVIIHNAKIATLDPANPDATAVVIDKGKFSYVGNEAAALRQQKQNTRVIDAGGRRVIPGLNDSHLHIIRGGLNYNMELRWDGVPSLADAMRMLKEQARITPPPQWVRVVGGFCEWQFAEKRLPTLDELNEAAPDTPVFILHLYDRALLNRAALRAVGYDRNTPEPPGGFIERDKNGQPTGLLVAKPNARILYKTLSLGPRLAPDDQLNSTRHFMRELNRLGVTSVIDAGGGFQNYPDDYKIIETLHRDRQLTTRIAYNLFTQKPKEELNDFSSWSKLLQPRSGDDFYRHNGAGEMLVYTAADFEDFREPRPDMPATMETELEPIVKLLAENRWPFRLHATYDETINRALDVFERVHRHAPIDKLHWFIDHAETISQRNIERIKLLGGGIAIQHRMAFQGEYFIQRYGAQAAQKTPPIREMLRAGVPVGAGTDATRVASFNPWVSLYWLVTGKTVGGTALYSESNRLERNEALRLYTKGSAWFSGEENKKGAIAPGQLADLVVLSDDYFACPEENIKSIESVLTMVDGGVVHGRGPFEKLAPPLPPPSPDWSPSKNRFANKSAENKSRLAAPDNTVAGANLCCGQSEGHVSNQSSMWGQDGCDCFVF